MKTREVLLPRMYHIDKVYLKTQTCMGEYSPTAFTEVLQNFRRRSLTNYYDVIQCYSFPNALHHVFCSSVLHANVDCQNILSVKIILRNIRTFKRQILSLKLCLINSYMRVFSNVSFNIFIF